MILSNNKIKLLVLLANSCISTGVFAGQIILNQAEPSSGIMQIEGRRDTKKAIKSEASQTFDIDGKAKSIKITLDVDSRRVPKKTSSHVTAEFKFRTLFGNKKDVSIELESALADRLDCTNLFHMSKSGDQIKIDVEPIILINCKDERAQALNPNLIGSRDIRGKEDLFHNLYSESSEAGLGQDFVGEFNKENSANILDSSHPLSVYAQNLMNNIVSHSDLKNVQPKVFVINANVLNAFALPGGYVYVFTGLIDAARSESELAAVLGHEWAHVVARHGTENMSRAIRTMIGVSVAALSAEVYTHTPSNTYEGARRKAIIEVFRPLLSGMMMVGGQLNLLQKGRDAETEADTLGSQYAYASGFQGWGIASMFEVFQSKSPNQSTSLEKLLSTHPDHQSRIDRSYDLAGFVFAPSTSAIASTSQFLNAKSELQKLPSVNKTMSEMVGNKFIESVNNMVINSVGEHVMTK